MFSFKMSENSLFAILLRKPWWVSGLVTLGVVAISFAILPPRFVIFGLAVALPFPVIAAMAGWRQLQAPSAARVEAVGERAARMNWKQFADELEAAWTARGFQVERLEGGGADFELTQGWRKTVVSARRWKTRQLGAEPVRALLSAREAREAQSATIIVIGELSAPARKLAKERSVEVMDTVGLAAILPPR